MRSSLQKIRKRQTAKLLEHLELTGQLTPELRADLLRAMRWIFEDVMSAISVKDR